MFSTEFSTPSQGVVGCFPQVIHRAGGFSTGLSTGPRGSFFFFLTVSTTCDPREIGQKFQIPFLTYVGPFFVKEITKSVKIYKIKKKMAYYVPSVQIKMQKILTTLFHVRMNRYKCLGSGNYQPGSEVFGACIALYRFTAWNALLAASKSGNS